MYVDGSPYVIYQDTHVGRYVLIGGTTVVIVGLTSVYGGAAYLYVLTNPEVVTGFGLDAINSALPGLPAGSAGGFIGWVMGYLYEESQ